MNPFDIVYVLPRAGSMAPLVSQLGSETLARSTLETTIEVVSEHNNPDGRLTNHKQRVYKIAGQKAVHRVKNGVYDVYTYYHLLAELGRMRPWTPFTSAKLTEWLNSARPTFIWDAVTVGRVLNDLHESWQESNPGDEHQPLIIRKTWQGNVYELTDYPAARRVMLNLADDLVALVDRTHAQELMGYIEPRLSSPLTLCPSIVNEEKKTA